MTIRHAAAFAVLAALAATLAGCAAGAEHHAAAARPAAAPALAAEPEPTTPEGLLPGVPLGNLSDPKKAVLAAWARETYCYCGCPHTVSQCLRVHGGCHHAKRMARLASALVSAGADPAEVKKQVTGYYAGFSASKRARLELGAWGPPLGQPDAGVALVEFSDFTCPFCQLFRPVLERFVQDRPGRVRLYYKPFPIESHPDALEAAQAGEWAREKGIFWKLHDRLFEKPHASRLEQSGWARDLGQDGVDLEAALASQRLLPRVRASQAEAREAGLRATPTLYLEGRQLPVLSVDLVEFVLEFALEDEEEWRRSGGWGPDLGDR
jgi:protein-disulfide isomerase